MLANVLLLKDNYVVQTQLVSGNIPYRFPICKRCKKDEKGNRLMVWKLNWKLYNEIRLYILIWIKLTISPSSPPKSNINKRMPSSADAFNLSNGYDQITLAGGPKPLSSNENPRSKCTINWHGLPWKRKKKIYSNWQKQINFICLLAFS